MSYRAGYFIKANEGVYGVVRAALPEGFELVTLADDPAAQARDLDFLIAGKASRALIEAAPKLKLIQAPGVGYDGIDLAAAAERGVPVAIAVCGNPDEVAEYALMSMLAVSRRLVELDRALRGGKWMMWDRRLASFNLKGKTLGVVGLGRIGREVARRAAGFDMRVQYCDPNVSAPYPRLPLEELLATSDYVSLHVPLTPETRGMLSRGRIGCMKPGSILINTSRGEVVDEGALIDALREGRLAGAGLDVFEREPPVVSNPLLAMDNVVVTPHVASGTLDALRVKARHYAENMRRVLDGREPLDCIQLAGAAQA